MALDGRRFKWQANSYRSLGEVGDLRLWSPIAVSLCYLAEGTRDGILAVPDNTGSSGQKLVGNLDGDLARSTQTGVLTSLGTAGHLGRAGLSWSE